MFKTITLAKFVLFSAYFCSINILSLKYVNIKIYLKYRNKVILISKDSESIEGDQIIIEYIFTEVKTNDILLLISWF